MSTTHPPSTSVFSAITPPPTLNSRWKSQQTTLNVSSFPSIMLLLTLNTAFLSPPLSLYFFILYFSFETQRKSPAPHVAFPNTPVTLGSTVSSDTHGRQWHTIITALRANTKDRHRVHLILCPLVKYKICPGNVCMVLKDYSSHLLKIFISF